jgi:transcriptional regulator with XRE-family HTH domain
MVVNKRLRELRKSLGLTQKEFAESISMGQSSLGMIERGARRLTEKNLRLICSTYGVSYEWLAFGEGNPYRMADDDVELIESAMSSNDEELKAILLGICKLSPLERKSIKGLVKKLDRIISSETYQQRNEPEDTDN